nr:MAG TPA: hypothetical protein [Caudoviricetes sp.]
MYDSFFPVMNYFRRYSKVSGCFSLVKIIR